MVGRQTELEELQQYFDLAAQGKGTTIFVSGEAGSGKTRLITEFIDKVKKKGATVLSGWCLSNAAVPYFPFVEAFNAYFSSSSEEEQLISFQQPGFNAEFGGVEEIGKNGPGITSWLTSPRPFEMAGKPEALTPQVWKDQAFAAVTKMLHGISAQEPLILFLDDVHWADSASLALLHYIARSIASERVLVLAAFRSEELIPDIEGRSHPLVEALRLMRREDLFKEVKLQSLDQTSVSILAGNMVGGLVNSELAEKLESKSQGNPLFVVESLRMLSEKGDLVKENNRWSLSTDELSIPAKIKDIILRRAATLKPNQRKLLDVASVIGSKFDPELLGAVLGQDSFEVLETLGAVAQSSSLVVCEGSFYRFDHAKSRDALYEEIPLPLRKAYHSRIADRLETNLKGSEKPPVSDLAYHYSQAGNNEKAVKYSLAAGEDALALFCGTAAIKHFKFVLDATAESKEYFGDRAIAMEGLGVGLFANGEFKKAVKVLEQLSSGTNSGLLKLRAQKTAARAAFFQGNYAHALEIVKKPVENPPVDRLEIARFNSVKGMIESLGFYVAEGKQDLEGALRVFEEEYSLSDMTDALANLALDYILQRDPENSSSLGQPEKSIAAMLRSITLSEYLRAFDKQDWAFLNSFIVYLKCNLQKEAMDVVTESLKTVEKISDPMTRASNLAIVYWMAGWATELEAEDKLFSSLQFESTQDFGTEAKINSFMAPLISGASEFRRELGDAVVQSLKALENAEETDSYEFQALSYGNLARDYALLGQIVQAENYFGKMKKIFDETSLAGFGFASLMYMLSNAVLFSCKGQWQEANEYYEGVIAAYRKGSPATGVEAGMRRGYSMALLQQGRFEDAKRQYEEAKETTDELEKRLVHSNILGYLVAPMKVEVGKEFNMRLDLVNVAKNPGVLVKIEGLFSADFKVTDTQPHAKLESGFINMEKKRINSFQEQSITFTVQPTKAGDFTLNPQILYIDDLGETKTCLPKPVSIMVKPVRPEFEVVPGRVSSGLADLDALLLGGIPERYAVMLTAPSSDERELLIKKFLKVGAETGETTFFLTCEIGSAGALAEAFQSNFSLFICNPQAEAIEGDLPNVYKLKGVDNLTDIDIALTKYFRALDSAKLGPKRACIEILSDVLLQHHAVATRKWLSGLLPNLKSKGFTTLAVIDPQMHPPEESRAIISLFDGEIVITEKETAKGLGKFLKVKKLVNQRYQDYELAITKEKLLP
jgi:KaiC/GvpD/RAD55 family RecA-like ATPase/tetratricopeptide (TPR) repeat protein